MSKKPQRAFSDVASIEADLATKLAELREALSPADGSPEDEAMVWVENFCAVAVKVMRKTNPSKIRDAALSVEIKARMDGVECR